MKEKCDQSKFEQENHWVHKSYLLKKLMGEMGLQSTAGKGSKMQRLLSATAGHCHGTEGADNLELERWEGEECVLKLGERPGETMLSLEYSAMDLSLWRATEWNYKALSLVCSLCEVLEVWREAGRARKNVGELKKDLWVQGLREGGIRCSEKCGQSWERLWESSDLPPLWRREEKKTFEQQNLSSDFELIWKVLS